MILSGREGLEEVAKKEGKWNWALVGPNPDSLPLVGGGSGSIDEMRHCLAKQEAEQKAENQYANFYGLLRLKFGTGRMGRTKYVFVQASRVDERGEAAQDESNPKNLKRGMSAVRHGQAMSKKGEMEKALLEFTHFTAKVEANSLDDLDVNDIIQKVQKASQADADLLTNESYYTALEEFVAAHPPAQPAPETAANDTAMTELCAADVFASDYAPSAEALQAVQEDAGDDDEGVMTRSQTGKSQFPNEVPPVEDDEEDEAAAPSGPAAQAKPDEPEAPKYKRGDLLFVYSNAAKQWMDDGIVVAVLTEEGEHDGLNLPKHSVKVQYNNRRQFKWVTPAQVKAYVRPSKRPVPPPTLLGELLKETHNWISQWHVRYFELSKGYLQWWMTSDDAKNGMVPNGSLSLTGLEMTVKDTVLYIRTATSKGMIYAFDATTAESVGKWSEMMKHHEEYCRKMQTYLTQRATDMEQTGKQEKFTNLVGERKRRASRPQNTLETPP